MRIGVVGLALGVVVSVSLAACSDASEPKPFETKTKDTTVVSPPELYEEIVVKEDRLEVPAGHPALANIAVGGVVTGLPSTKHPEQNPYGYWRRVTEIRPEGAWVILMTEQASLAEAFERAQFDVVLSDNAKGGAPPTSGAKGTDVSTQSLSPQTLRPLAEGDTEFRATFAQNFTPREIINGADVAVGGSSVGAERKIRLEGGFIKVEPYVRLAGEFEASFSEPVKRFDTTVGIDYQGELSLSVSSQLSFQQGIVLKGVEIKKELIPSRVLKSGVFMIGWVPVPYTLRFRTEVACTWSIAGTVKLTTTHKVEGNPYAALHYRPDSGWTYDDKPLDMRHTRENKVDAEGQLELRCQLEPRLGIYIADSAGPYVTVSPYVAAQAKASTECPPPGVNFQVVPGVEMKFGAEANVFGSGTLASRHFKVDFPFDPWVQAGKQCGGAGVSEPCVGRADGYYCGAEINGEPGQLYSCNDNKTSSKTPCPNQCQRDGDNVSCQ